MSYREQDLIVERSTSTGHRLTHYRGVCGNLHGHNMDWYLKVTVRVNDDDETQMPIDLKEVASAIDEVDHATLLKADDRLVDALGSLEAVEDALGDVVWFDQDPTCENVALWMADRIVTNFDAAVECYVELRETDKYGITARYP